MNDYAFGNFLYALRTEKGLSQVQLGDMLGVTNKAVSKWETGASKPTITKLTKLSKIYNVGIDELGAYYMLTFGYMISDTTLIKEIKKSYFRYDFYYEKRIFREVFYY